MIWINELAKTMSGFDNKSIADHKHNIEFFISALKDQLNTWEKINLKWFGRFSFVKRKARKWSNPYNWDPIDISARTSLKFEVAAPYHRKIKNFNI